LIKPKFVAPNKTLSYFFGSSRSLPISLPELVQSVLELVNSQTSLVPLQCTTRSLCCRPSVCRLFVCNARAPYLATWNFQEYFFAIGTLAILWHSRKIVRRSSQGNPSGGRVKRNRVSQI